MSTFAHFNLNDSINQAIQACGYTKPTSVQSRAIPEILLKKDLVASAQTGTGKTAAFVLPALHQLTLNKPKSSRPRILILTPTRELATQITEATSLYGKFIKFSLASLVGGMSYKQQLRSLSRPVDIIVATPGRLMDHMENRRVDLSQIEMLILDEADRMLDMGFIDDIKYISKTIPSNRQTLLFSATFDRRISEIVNQLLKNPVRIDLSNETITPTQIKQELYMANSPLHKSQLLHHFLQNENIFKAIIFSATKINADRLANELEDAGFSASALHGDLKQSVRTKTLEQLRRGKIQFLVATDVAARGLDVSDITHVINYDLPKFSEDYVHRIGRTGRAGKTGIAISFALRHDFRHIQKIERFIGQRLPLCTIPGLEPKLGKEKDNNRFKKERNEKPFHKSKAFSKDKPRFSKERGESNTSFRDKPRFGKDRSDSNKSFKKDRGDFSRGKPRFDKDRGDSNKSFRKDREDFNRDKPRFGKDRGDANKSFKKDREDFSRDKPRFGKNGKDFNKDKPRFGKDRENFKDKLRFGKKTRGDFKKDSSRFGKDSSPVKKPKKFYGPDSDLDFRKRKKKD